MRTLALLSDLGALPVVLRDSVRRETREPSREGVKSSSSSLPSLSNGTGSASADGEEARRQKRTRRKMKNDWRFRMLEVLENHNTLFVMLGIVCVCVVVSVSELFATCSKASSCANASVALVWLAPMPPA